jgi:predicted ATP-grasp superfamily ATP-dependent carboligase
VRRFLGVSNGCIAVYNEWCLYPDPSAQAKAIAHLITLAHVHIDGSTLQTDAMPLLGRL